MKKPHMGNVIHGMALELGLKAEDIAPHLGKSGSSVSTVYDIYKREDVSTGILYQLSAFFKKPIAAFYGDAYDSVLSSAPEPEYSAEQIRELHYKIEKLELQVAHKDELLAIYKATSSVRSATTSATN